MSRRRRVSLITGSRFSITNILIYCIVYSCRKNCDFTNLCSLWGFCTHYYIWQQNSCANLPLKLTSLQDQIAQHLSQIEVKTQAHGPFLGCSTQHPLTVGKKGKKGKREVLKGDSGCVSWLGGYNTGAKFNEGAMSLALFQSVIRIRIHMFLGFPDPDPLVRCMDLAPDPSIIMQKK